MAIYFISDVHLGENFPEREADKRHRLFSFLEMISGPENQLIIVGDLFDFWFEYKHAIPREHQAVILKLAQLKSRGIRLIYITGNHDHWLGDYLSKEIGLEIYRDYFDTTLDGQRIYITHGDGLASKDRGYRLLKRILQSRLNIFLYRLIPVDIGIPLAKFVSRVSRGHTQKRPKESFLQEYRDYARQRLKEGFAAVIIAHTHVPEQIAFPEGLYLNTGDWIENFTYVVCENGCFELKKWNG